MCKYTYHHYAQCGHIGAFTVDGCWHMVENLRRGPADTTKCFRTEHLDLLPADHPHHCRQCLDAKLKRLMQQQLKSLSPSNGCSDTSSSSSSPAFTQLEGLGDCPPIVTAEFKMTVQKKAQDFDPSPAPAPRQQDVSHGELPRSNDRPPSPPNVVAPLEVRNCDHCVEKNSPVVPAPADDDVSDIWLDISQPTESSGFYDSDSDDDTYPDLGEVSDTEEEDEEEEEEEEEAPASESKEKLKQEPTKAEEKKPYFRSPFDPPTKSTPGSPPPAYKPNVFRSAADPILDLPSEDPRVKNLWYPFFEDSPFIEDSPKNPEPCQRTFLQSPSPRRLRLARILYPNAYNNDVKPLSIGTGFQSESSHRTTNKSPAHPRLFPCALPKASCHDVRCPHRIMK